MTTIAQLGRIAAQQMYKQALGMEQRMIAEGGLADAGGPQGPAESPPTAKPAAKPAAKPTAKPTRKPWYGTPAPWERRLMDFFKNQGPGQPQGGGSGF
jgi:hypothetical protein